MNRKTTQINKDKIDGDEFRAKDRIQNWQHAKTKEEEDDDQIILSFSAQSLSLYFFYLGKGKS